MLVLVTVLSLNLGIRCNPDLIAAPSAEDLRSTAFFRNPEDLFLHGIINRRTGTCSSLPVLTVSVGRLMGYPLRLVNAKAHLFVRWEDGKERFNIESGGHGLICHPDEHYMKWPFVITEKELKTGFFLKSVTPAQELATFLEIRAFCLLENKRTAEACEAFGYALSLYPGHPYLKGYIESLKTDK
jgi:regulator of sirC expression with transglutaminase-like and TPR domain